VALQQFVDNAAIVVDCDPMVACRLPIFGKVAFPLCAGGWAASPQTKLKFPNRSESVSLMIER